MMGSWCGGERNSGARDIRGSRDPWVRAWRGNRQLPFLVVCPTLLVLRDVSVVVLVPCTGDMPTLGPLATSVGISTIPVPAGTAARLLGWVLRSKTAFRFSSYTFFFFSFSLFSAGVEVIGGV